jgi:hypothetical protein
MLVAVGATMLALGTGFALFLVGTALRWLFLTPADNHQPPSTTDAPAVERGWLIIAELTRQS